MSKCKLCEAEVYVDHELTPDCPRGKDIDWILTDSIRVRRDGATPGYMVASLDNTKHAYLSWSADKDLNPILLFNGEYIETEAFMAYVGLMDQVDESPNRDIICTEDFVTYDL